MSQTLSYENALSVLVIRPGALGDTILTVPVIESIGHAFPGARITWLGTARYASLIPRHVHFESFDDPRWLWLFASESDGLPVGVPRFDRAYAVLNNARPVLTNLIRTGTAEISHVKSTPPEDIHLVEHLHQGLGLSTLPRKLALGHLASEEKNDLLWVHPGSGGPGKCIPPATMASMVDKIRGATGWTVAVTAGEEDAFLKNDPGWKSLTAGAHTRILDSRPLSEVCQELAGSRLFMGNDCGISHLAAGLGIPSVVFFSATNPAQWAPWTEENRLMICDLRDMAMDLDIDGILQWARESSPFAGKA